MMLRGAQFSPCKTWRYSLTREWLAGHGKLVLVMLNPSRADDQRDDATTTLMVRRAQRDGFRQYEAVNLFALVATDPKVLRTHHDPIGPDNDAAILDAAKTADSIIVAWGIGCNVDPTREEAVLALLEDRELWCFGETKSGHPKFPRALRAGAPLELWRNGTACEKSS